MDKGDGNGFIVQGQTNNGSSLTFLQNNLTPGVTYYFIIVAQNSVGLSADSVSRKIIAGTPPNQPNAPTKVSASSTAITINWTQPANTGESSITGYKILWNSGVGSVQTVLMTTNNLIDLTYSITSNINGGMTYKF